jgi:hypothetical protein
MTITVEGSANHNAQPAIWIRHLKTLFGPGRSRDTTMCQRRDEKRKDGREKRINKAKKQRGKGGNKDINQ